MGIIATPAITSVIAPQANAINATHEIILDIINAIQTKINNNLDVKVSTRSTQTSVDNLQTTANAIKAKTDTLPLSGGDSGTVKSVTFYKVVNVCSLMDPQCGSPNLIPIELIPAQSGKTFSGHITMSADRLNSQFGVTLYCDAPSVQIPIGDAVPGIGSIGTNFSCQRLWLNIHNDGNADESTDISGVVQYVETSNESTLP